MILDSISLALAALPYVRARRFTERSVCLARIVQYRMETLRPAVLTTDAHSSDNDRIHDRYLYTTFVQQRAKIEKFPVRFRSSGRILDFKGISPFQTNFINNDPGTPAQSFVESAFKESSSVYLYTAVVEDGMCNDTSALAMSFGTTRLCRVILDLSLLADSDFALFDWSSVRAVSRASGSGTDQESDDWSRDPSGRMCVAEFKNLEDRDVVGIRFGPRS